MRRVQFAFTCLRVVYRAHIGILENKYIFHNVVRGCEDLRHTLETQSFDVGQPWV
jgi:hypothetical protein